MQAQNSTSYLFSLIVLFFAAWQTKTIVGLILLDVLLGIACAFRTGGFQWARVAEFYRTMVIPYVIGYLALFVAIGYIIPPNVEGLEFLNQALVTAAWLALLGALLGSIKQNAEMLYKPGE